MIKHAKFPVRYARNPCTSHFRIRFQDHQNLACTQNGGGEVKNFWHTVRGARGHSNFEVMYQYPRHWESRGLSVTDFKPKGGLSVTISINWGSLGIIFMHFGLKDCQKGGLLITNAMKWGSLGAISTGLKCGKYRVFRWQSIKIWGLSVRAL